MNTAIQTTVSTPRYLGAAEVIAVNGERARVRLGDGRDVDARLALAVPYRPLRRDELLVLGDGTQWFVIGVLSGRGRIALQDTELRITARGRLRLHAEEALRIHAKRLDAVFHGSVRWDLGAFMKELGCWTLLADKHLSLLTRDAHELVVRRWMAQARRVSMKVKEVFHINGKTVRLG